MNWAHPKLIITALGAVALLWPATAESPIGAATPPASPSFTHGAPDPVTIQHEIIHVPVRVTRSPRRHVSVNATRLAAASRPPHGKPDSIVVRAGRLLVGDGRYRPEPFPRPSR